MNNAYRVVWNAVTKTWTAVSEHARGRSKGATRNALVASVTLTAAIAGAGFATNANAYVAGNGAVQGDSRHTVIGDNADGSAAGCNSTYLPGTACSTIIGNSASSTGRATTVIGDHATSSGANSIAIGAYANAAQYSQAIGAGADATGGWATAIGQSATATGRDASAIGTNSSALGARTVALGSGAHAEADDSFALGWSASAVGTGSMAFGTRVTANGDNAVALGLGSAANGSSAIAIGANAEATPDNSVALGAGSIADRTNSVSVGATDAERQIVNVAAGTQTTDAVNFGQLTNTAQSVATALGGGAAVAADGTIIAPTYTLKGTDYHTVGDALSNLDTRVTNVENISATGNPYLAVSRPTGPASATGDYSLAVGMSTRSTGVGSVAVGSSASASANGAIAMGQNSRATNNNSTAIGYVATASGGNATAFGTNSVASGGNAVGLGNNATASAGNSAALGNYATSGAIGSIAIGSTAKVVSGAAASIAIGQAANVAATADNAVALGANSSATRASTVSIGAAGSERQLTNMAAGTATTDAVNVSQLQGVTNALGGGASVDASSGAIVAPTYNVQGGTQNTVGDALDALDGGLKTAQGDITNLDGRVTTNETNITNLQQQIGSGTIGLVQQTGPGADLTVGAGTDGARVNFADQNGNARTLANVANGVADKDAVNVSQLRSELASASASDTAYFQADGWSSKGDAAKVQAGSYGVAIGSNARATGENSVALGADSVADRDNVVSVGWGMGGNGTRQIVNVANGNENTDAVNVQQLKPVIAGLGGGASINANNGVVTGPTYNVQGGTQHTVGDALDALDGGLKAAQGDITNLDGRVTTNETSITNLQQQIGSGTIGLVQQTSLGADLTVGAGTDGARVNFADQNGNARTLANVANGVADSDAVNVSQLKAAQGQIGDLDQLAVKYGDASQASITLGGANGTQIHNVADGTADHDAANVGQLNAAATQLGDQITTVNNNLTQLGNQVASGKVGLVQQAAAGADLTVGAGTDGARVNFADQNGNARTLANVANGVADSDAVNVAQLKATQGQIGDLDQLAVKYGDASQASITLGGANGTQIHNVADGTADNDAVNLSQLKNVQAQIGDVGAQLGGAVMYDRFADGSLNLGSVTLGGVGSAAVTLTNVANGAVNATSTDAVNGSQLYALQTQVDDISGRLGPVTVKPGNGYFDGTDASKDAAATTPVYAGSGVGNTAGGSGATIADGVDNSSALGSNTSVTADNAVALGAASVADRANSVSVGSAGNERAITNVAAGTAPTDAANTQQVNDALKSANNYTDSSVGALSNSMNQRFDDTNRAINQVAKNAYAGIAAAMAMPNMTPSGPGKTIVAAGGATYKGGSAVAAGATYRSRDGKWLVNGALSVTSTGDAGARAQVGYEF
ncbi:beta strand repeat-containing protein [Burkholderia sp. Z1]|uniref:beta strand repeat-containing protein n=1 Tax=Burkholderia sp. Z1 TaxID=2759039 RepID=UPI001866A994|nr:YadA-like family protein [Burkholderia sp. Z1]